MKIIDKTPLLDKKGKVGGFRRLQGRMQYGSSWYPDLEAQRFVINQLDRVLEKGFTLIRNLRLSNSEIVEPIILIGPPGVYVLQITTIKGFYEAKEGQWNLVKNGQPIPAKDNLMIRVGRLARALEVYLERQGVKLAGPVEPVLIASSPALHVESSTPIARVVLSDAIRQFAGSLLLARPVLSAQYVHDLTERLITPRLKSAIPEPILTEIPTSPTEPKPTEPTPLGQTPLAQAPLGQTPLVQATVAQAPLATTRARAIFHAAEEQKPFDPDDLSFAFDEEAENENPENLPEPGQTQRLPRSKRRGGMKPLQWILLTGMFLVEACILAGFGYLIYTNAR